MSSIPHLDTPFRSRDPERLPRWAAFFQRSLTPWMAIRRIALVTLAVTLAAAFVMWTFNGDEFPTLGGALWWAAQTVSTVGYGDTVPGSTSGRVVAVLVMASGIAFLTISTAAVSATLIDGVHRRLAEANRGREAATLEEIRERLERIEAALAAQSRTTHRR
jgi:voltage-gated potassium channel